MPNYYKQTTAKHIRKYLEKYKHIDKEYLIFVCCFLCNKIEELEMKIEHLAENEN